MNYREKTKNELINELEVLKQEFEASKTSLNREIAEREKTAFSLMERMKELRCHNEIATILSNANLALDDVLEKIIQIIPDSMQFPEIAGVSIKINDKVFKTQNFVKSKHTLSQQISLHFKIVGHLEVSYAEALLPPAKQIFLPEETELLFSVAQRIGGVIEKMEREHTLAQNHATLQKIIESINDVIYEISAENVITFVSPSIEKLVGYKPDELIGKNFTSFIYEPDLLFVLETFALLPGIVLPYIEYRIVAKNGSLCWIRSSASVIFENDKIVGITGSITNITHQKQIETELQTSESLYRSILNASPDVITITDLEGKVLFTSPKALEMFGYDHIETFKGRSILEYVIPECHEKAIYGISQMLLGNLMGAEEYIALRQDGSTFDVEINGEFVRDEHGIPQKMIFITRDISDRKMAEEKLRHSEEQFRHLVESIKDVIYEIGANGTVNYVSPSVNQIIGYEQDEVIGHSFLEFVHPDDKAALMNAFKNLESRKYPYFEYRYIAKNGNIHWVRSSTTAIIKDGKMIGGNGSMTDITEWKKANDALAESEEKYRLMFFDNPQPMVIYDIETLAFLEVNEAAIKQYGYSRAEFLQFSIKDLHSPEDIASVIEDVELSKNNQNSLTEWKHFGKNKTQFFVELTSHSVIFKGRKARHVLINDITARKHAEDAVQESSQKLEAIISASPDGIGMISFDGKLKLVSAKLALMYGYSVEEKDAFIGKSVIDFIDPSYHKIMKENIQKLLSGSVNHHITEYLAIRKDNSRFYSESNSTVLFDPNGKPTDILYTQRDITDRKEAENELIQREGLLNSIIETARDSIFIKDASLTYIKVNKAMASLFGRPKEEIVGKSDAELFGAASGDHIEEIDRQVLLGQTVEEFPSKPVNGEIKHFHTIKVPLKDVNGQTYGLCGIARDITESKQAEKALQSSEERFRAISEYSSSSICILNTAGKVIWVNDAMLKMTGYTSEQVYSTESFTAFLAPECAEFVITNFMKFVNHGDYEHHYQFSIIRADGEKRLCEKFMSHYEDQSGKLNLIISMMDITERHYAEQSLRTNRQELINSNNQLEMAQRIGHSGSWLYDIETQKIWGSGEAKRLFGFEKDEEFFTLENIEACIPDRERIHQALIDLIVNGTPYDVEYVLQPADGSNPRAILSKARIEKDETGKVISIIGVVQDITDRVSAEQNLVESEEKFRAIAEQTSDFISISNSNGQITYASPASALVFDIAPEDMLGRNFIGFVDESDIERAIQTFVDCLKNDSKIKNAEFKMNRADGSEFIGELNASKFQTGTQFGTLVTIRDITERKLANEALMASEEKYRLLFYNNPQPMWIYDIETLAFLEVNQAAITHYGYSRDEFLSMTLRDIRPAEDIADLLKDVELSKNNQNSQIEWRHLRKNKELRIVEITAQSLIFNGRSARHVLIIDITERKKAEEELRKFRTISDQANYGAAVSALDGSFIYVNNAFALMHGYETHELIGKDHKIVHNEEQLARVDEIMALISANRGFVSEEIYHTRKDGTTFPTLMSAAVIYNEKNIPQFLSTTTIDITESKLAEQEIHDLNENLETKIIIRTIQLEETNEILQNEIQSRMLVEVELALEKHRLSEIIEGTNVGTWEWNIQTGQAIFNERWAEIIGYTLDELAPVSIDTWMKFAHPDDIILSGQLMEKHFKGELAYYSFESRMKHKNGEWVWVLDRGKVHDWDMDHKPLMMSGTHQDITESKRASEFETELLQLSLQLTGIPVSEIVPALNMALQRIGGFLGADRAYIFEISDTEKTMSNTFEWCNTGINPEIENLKDVPLEILPKWMEIIQKHENIIIPSVKDLAEDWVAEREILEPQGIQSLVVIPMFIGNMLIGFVGLDSVLNKREYKDSEINILKVWGNMLASLLNHQRKEEFIEQTRRNYETFFNTIDDFLFVLDQQGNIIHTNTTVTRRLGYDTKELLEKSILMVHPAERRDEAGYTVGEMLAGTTEFCPVPLVTKSGEYIPVETRVKHGLWDGRPAIFGVTKDVSKIKLSEEKFSKAFQSNSALMAISNLDGRFLEVNNMFLKTLGFTREEIIGYNTHNLQIYENVELRDEMVERLKQNIPVKEVEMKVRTKSGEMRIGLYSADTIYIGKDLCLLTMMVDITERKQAEEKINQARDEAEKANRAKSEFLSRMSHELRTPMNSILGFAQLMEMGELNISQKKGVKHILNSGKHLLNLINEVLDISRIEAGRISLSMEPIHIGGVIMEMLDAMQPNAAKMNIKTGLQNSSADKLFVVADYQRLKQVLLNLLANAFKYNIKGGSVNVQTELMERPEPEITTIRISISDTGVGISAEDLPKLFQPFERIGAEKGETEGTGLGLTVVKKLMEAMGGAIGVTSQVGQGSTFWIELPLAKSQKSLAEQTEWATKLEKGITKTAGTILYIEDNVSNIELVEQILTTQRPGNRLIANMSGNMAVSLAIEYMPDLILLDLDLPDIHGSEVLKNLQAEAKTKYIPVIIISADAMSDRIEKLTLAGVKDYLTKPLDIITFLKAVDTWIK